MFSIISYMLTTASCCCASLIKEFNKGKDKYLFGFALLLCLSIFLCSGYMTGSDWPNYENAFYGRELFLKEQGLSWLYSIAKTVGLEFWPTFIILKFFCFVCFIYLLKNICNNFWLTLALLLPIIGFFLFIDNPMRNLIAMSFFWLACVAYMKERKKLCFALIVIAITNHYSTLCVLSVLSIIYFKHYLIKHYKITLFTIILLYCLLSSNTLLMSLFLNLLKLIGVSRGIAYFADAYNKYSKFTLFSPTMLLQFMCFLFIYINRIKNTNSEIKSTFFIICIIHLLLSRLAYSILILNRLAMFTEPIFAAILINTFDYYKDFKLRYFFKFNVIVFSLLFTLKTITSAYSSDGSLNVYLPYSNYFIEETLLQKNIPFYERKLNNSKSKYSSLNDVL